MKYPNLKKNLKNLCYRLIDGYIIYIDNNINSYASWVSVIVYHKNPYPLPEFESGTSVFVVHIPLDQPASSFVLLLIILDKFHC
jgi:hypothetical protein